MQILYDLSLVGLRPPVLSHNSRTTRAAGIAGNQQVPIALDALWVVKGRLTRAGEAAVASMYQRLCALKRKDIPTHAASTSHHWPRQRLQRHWEQGVAGGVRSSVPEFAPFDAGGAGGSGHRNTRSMSLFHKEDAAANGEEEALRPTASSFVEAAELQWSDVLQFFVGPLPAPVEAWEDGAAVKVDNPLLRGLSLNGDRKEDDTDPLQHDASALAPPHGSGTWAGQPVSILDLVVWMEQRMPLMFTDCTGAPLARPVVLDHGVWMELKAFGYDGQLKLSLQPNGFEHRWYAQVYNLQEVEEDAGAKSPGNTLVSPGRYSSNNNDESSKEEDFTSQYERLRRERWAVGGGEGGGVAVGLSPGHSDDDEMGAEERAELFGYRGSALSAAAYRAVANVVFEAALEAQARRRAQARKCCSRHFKAAKVSDRHGSRLRLRGFTLEEINRFLVRSKLPLLNEARFYRVAALAVEKAEKRKARDQRNGVIGRSQGELQDGIHLIPGTRELFGTDAVVEW